MFRYFARHKLGGVLFVFVLLFSCSSAVYFLYRGQKRIQHLYVPKLLALHIDEVPFPKNGKRKPIDVMAGSLVSITCETISPLPKMGSPGYRFHVGGRTYETTRGKLNVAIPGEIGSIQQVSLDYLLKKTDGTTQVVDQYKALVRLTPGGEYFRIHGFGNRKGEALPDLTVPMEVIPYVDAAVKITGVPEDYVVLFFTEAYGTKAPVLQVTSHARSNQRIEAIAAPLRRYRGFGPRIGGYAAWPDEPIQLGSPNDARMIFEVYAGLFEAKKVKSVVDKLLTYEETIDDGHVEVKVNPVRRAEIKALAWHGWLSESKRVVRGEDPPPQSESESAQTKKAKPAASSNSKITK